MKTYQLGNFPSITQRQQLQISLTLTCNLCQEDGSAKIISFNHTETAAADLTHTNMQCQEDGSAKIIFFNHTETAAADLTHTNMLCMA